MLAICFTSLGGFLSALGLVLMKLAHMRRQGKENQTSLLCSPIWIAGFTSLIVGSVLNIVALGYGNQVLLSSFAGFTIIANTVLSVLLLKEPFYKTDPIAIALMCLGSGGFLFFAKNSPQDYDFDTLIALYRKPSSFMFYVLTVVIAVGSILSDNNARNRLG